MTTDQFNPAMAPMCYPLDFQEAEQATIQEAIIILESRIRQSDAYTSPGDVKAFCRLQIANERDEYFCCMYLDSHS